MQKRIKCSVCGHVTTWNHVGLETRCVNCGAAFPVAYTHVTPPEVINERLGILAELTAAIASLPESFGDYEAAGTPPPVKARLLESVECLLKATTVEALAIERK